MSPTALPRPAPLRGLPELLLLMVAMVWGTSYGVAKEALAFYPVLGFLAVRFVLTAGLLAPAYIAAGATARREALRLGLPIGGMLLAIFLCETYGVARTRAANAAFLISLCVVLTPFAEWWLLGRRPARSALVCVGTSLAGAGLLAGGVGIETGAGDLLIVAAAVLRALIVCVISRWTRNCTVPTLALTAVQSAVVGGGCLLLIAAGAGTLPPLPSAPAFWYATVYLVLGCTMFAFIAHNWALRNTSPTRVALLTGSEPVFGALFAVAWLGEQLPASAWAGGILIVGAALWAAGRDRP